MSATALHWVRQVRWQHSLAWLALLAPLFFLSYGWANHLAATRGITSSLVFDWETAIPFLPWTIVPYWSIDLFYGLSFLACHKAREVNHHALRLLTAQCVSVACFIAFPLRFSSERPDTDGLFGNLFDALTSFDLPYNQAPSLHISLLLVIWSALVCRAAPGWRWLWHSWALLVAVSILTTWQHHFFDLPTGAMVGLLCLWLWPDQGDSPLRFRHTAHSQRIAVLYLGGALACLLLATMGGWMMWAAWPAASLGMVALNYTWTGVAGFQKQNGRQSLAVRWLLAPYRLGAWINSRWWTRRQPEPDKISDNIWIGRLPTSAQLAQGNFDAILDLTAEFNSPRSSVKIYSVPMLDLVLPTVETLAQAVAALDQAAGSSRRILVCCALGYSRSALTITAWLLQTGQSDSVTTAIAQVTAVRPQVVFSAGHSELLEKFIHV